MICENVELSFKAEKSQELGGSIQLPIASIPVPTGIVANSSTGASSTGQTATAFESSSVASKIFALELKQITTRGWFNKQLILKDRGPKVDPTRLAAGGDSDMEDDEDADISELELFDLSEDDFASFLQ